MIILYGYLVGAILSVFLFKALNARCSENHFGLVSLIYWPFILGLILVATFGDWFNKRILNCGDTDEKSSS